MSIKLTVAVQFLLLILFASSVTQASNTCFGILVGHPNKSGPGILSRGGQLFKSLWKSKGDVYEPIQLTDVTSEIGLRRISGNTHKNIGKYIVLAHTVAGQNTPVNVKGWLVGEYYKTIFILEQSTGKVIRYDIPKESDDSSSPGNVDRLVSAHIEPSAMVWSRFLNTKQNLISALIRNGKSWLLLFIQDGSSDGKKAIYGKAKIAELKPNYQVVEIIDQNGRRHLIDLDYIFFDAYVSSELNDGLPLLPTQYSKPEIIVDLDKTQRFNFVSEFAGKGLFFEDPEFYEYLQKNISYTKRILQRWYGDNASKIIVKVEKNLGKKYVPLLINPGIISRVDDFIRIVNASRLRPWTSLIEVRSYFSKKLGKRKVFRGILITPEQLETIKSYGLDAPGFLNLELSIQSLSEAFDPRERFSSSDFARGPLEELSARTGKEGVVKKDGRMYMSVSEYEEIAASVGYHASDKLADAKDRRLYIFEIEIPEIDLITRQGGLFKSRFLDSTSIVRIGDNFEKSVQDPGVEMMIPYHIPMKYIKSIKSFDEIPPTFSFYDR